MEEHTSDQIRERANELSQWLADSKGETADTISNVEKAKEALEAAAETADQLEVSNAQSQLEAARNALNDAIMTVSDAKRGELQAVLSSLSGKVVDRGSAATVSADSLKGKHAADAALGSEALATGLKLATGVAAGFGALAEGMRSQFGELPGVNEVVTQFRGTIRNADELFRETFQINSHGHDAELNGGQTKIDPNKAKTQSLNIPG